MGSPFDRIDAIRRAVKETAKEAGCSPTALECLWYYGDRTSENIVRIGRFMSWRVPGAPTGSSAARKAGLIGEAGAKHLLVTVQWFAPITPEGRRALWRLHERLNERDSAGRE